MERLEGLRRADAAIVGGGLTGLLLASSLAHEGLKVAVIDAIDGFSGPEWAAASLFGLPFARIHAIYGHEAAQQYAHALLSELHGLLSAPPAYIQEMPGYLYALFPAERPSLERCASLLTGLDLSVAIAPDAGGCPFPVEQSLMAASQAAVNVHSWMKALQQSILRRGGQLYSSSRVVGLEKQRIFTQLGCMQTGQIILTAGKTPWMGSRRIMNLLESRTQIWCRLTSFEPLHSLQFPLAPDGLMLLPEPTGVIAWGDLGHSGQRHAQMRSQQFQQSVSTLLPDHVQGETGFRRMCLSWDGLPFIGGLPGSSLLMAAGICSPLGAMHAARLLMQRMLGRTQPEDALYSPDRHIPASLLRQSVAKSSVRYAAGWLHPGAPECSLCGCRMRYLSPARRWECPYCGSAFTMLGQIIDGPAVRPARLSVRQRPDL